MRKWIKQYGWYVAVSILGGIFGAAVSLFIWRQKSLGTIAEWVSGLCSFGAIIFAYKQIKEQREEYEEDKKEELNKKILDNRPFFTAYKRRYLLRKKEVLWILVEDFKENVIKSIIDPSIDKLSDYVNFKNDINIYIFKNVTMAAATSITLKIEYKNDGETEKTDFCDIETCVDGKEQVIILPHSILSEPEKYVYCQKKISLYFSTIDDRVYCQNWTEKEEKPGKFYMQTGDLVEISERNMPKKGACNFIRFL